MAMRRVQGKIGFGEGTYFAGSARRLVRSQLPSNRSLSATLIAHVIEVGHTQSLSTARRLRIEQGLSTHDNSTSMEKMPSIADIHRVLYVDSAQKPTHEMRTAIRAVTIVKFFLADACISMKGGVYFTYGEPHDGQSIPPVHCMAYRRSQDDGSRGPQQRIDGQLQQRAWKYAGQE